MRESSWIRRLRGLGFNKRKWSKRYYFYNKDSILEQQRDYSQNNSYDILKRRRERYHQKRKSTKPYKPHRRIMETEENIVRLKERLEETEFKLKKLAEDYDVLDKKKEELQIDKQEQHPI